MEKIKQNKKGRRLRNGSALDSIAFLENVSKI